MYQLPQLAKVQGLVHGFSTHEEGNQGFRSKRNQPEDRAPKGQVIQNRGRLLRSVASAFQIGNGIGMCVLEPGFEETILKVDASRGGDGMREADSGPKCEAMITTSCVRPLGFGSEGGYLFLPVADCIPIILYDPVARVLGLVHGSRESTVRKIAAKTVRLMAQHFGARPLRMVAGLGPGIRTYDLEWFEPPADDKKEWQQFLTIVEGGRRVRVDLFGFNVHLLKTVGIPENQIEASPVDTFVDDRFFSHRAGRKGRFACAVGMVPIE